VNVYLINTNNSANAVYSLAIDPTVISGDVTGDIVIFESGQTSTSVKDLDLVVAPNGDLHACWVSKNATYPNSFNIRYSKSTDGGVTWESPTQVTTTNITADSNLNPSITINSLGNPVIVYQSDISSDYGISSLVFNGTAWDSAYVVYSGGVNFQSSPSVDALSDGTIIVAWHGVDAGDSSNNIRFSDSTDNGVTWSAMQKLTTSGDSNDNPSITRNSDDDIFIVTRDKFGGSFYDVALLEKPNGGSFGLPVKLTSNTANSSVSASTTVNYREFSKPLTVFKGDLNENDVKFYGKWTEGVELDLLDIDIRMNITPLQDVSDIGAYINISDNVLSVDGKVSIVDSAATESYTDLVDTRYPIDATNDEVASLLNSTVTPEDKVTLLYNLIRTLTTDDISLTSILGGVS